MQKIKVLYQYRDAANNKKIEWVVVEAESPAIVKIQLERIFADCQGWPDVPLFQPERLGWPTAYFENHDLLGDDVAFHEICEVALTDDVVTHELSHSR